MKIFRMLPVAMMLTIICCASVFAARLTVVTGAPVAPGATGVTVKINISDGSAVAGASFTLTYNTAKLILTSVTSPFFGTFASQNITPSSVTVDNVTYTSGLAKNPTTGGTMLAAARASNGSAGPQTLFVLKFRVLATASGNYPIKIVPSVITNPAAGYSTATPLPMLVGINSSTTPTSYPSLVPAITNGTLAVAVADTDGDGLTDTTETNMGTNPLVADTDGDGLNDGAESSYWQGNWNLDPDGDGKINILDPDADNDGFSDGIEASLGTNASDPTSRPVHVYENAENSNTAGWTIVDNDPAGAAVSNVMDEVRGSRVIQLSGDGTNNAFTLLKDNGANWRDATYKGIQWSMQSAVKFTVTVLVKTSNGNRNLTYTPINTNNPSTPTTIHHGLGGTLKNGTWQTVTRDLEQDLKDAEPANTLVEILRFQIRGNGRLDDIQTLYMPAP